MILAIVIIVMICRYYAANHLIPIYKCIFYTFACVYVIDMYCIKKIRKEKYVDFTFLYVKNKYNLNFWKIYNFYVDCINLYVFRYNLKLKKNFSSKKFIGDV